MKMGKKRKVGMEAQGVYSSTQDLRAVKRGREGRQHQQEESSSPTQDRQDGASQHPGKDDNIDEPPESSSGDISSKDLKKRRKEKKKKKGKKKELKESQEADSALGGGASTVFVVQAPTSTNTCPNPKDADSSGRGGTVVQSPTSSEVPFIGADIPPGSGAGGSGRGSTSPLADKSTPVPTLRARSTGEAARDNADTRDKMVSSPPKARLRKGKTHGKKPRESATEAAPTKISRDLEVGAHPSPAELLPSGPGKRTPRKHTFSIALPGSVVDNAQNRELKTYLVGEIARAAAIFEVDEIVVYDDLSVSRKGHGGVLDDSSTNGSSLVSGVAGAGGGVFAAGDAGRHDRNNPNVFMARLLQYAETPQYLRKKLFPMHPTLRLAGLLNPLDAPHHMRVDDDDCPFREGIVVDRNTKKGAGAFVDIGKRKEARIDRPLDPGVRVTVKLDQRDPCKRNHKGRAVAPSAPREELGLYWGYQTRLATGMADVLAGCPFKGGYDLTMGTSERGNVTVDDAEFALPAYRHALIVFGGVQGIEATIDADETLPLPGSEACALFDMWVNTCPGQGSRTIRTEEAVLITLARLRTHVLRNRG